MYVMFYDNEIKLLNDKELVYCSTIKAVYIRKNFARGYNIRKEDLLRDTVFVEITSKTLHAS